MAEDGTVHIVRGVSFHPVSSVGVQVRKHWGGGYYVLEGLECCFFFVCPCPRTVVLCEVVEGSGNVHEAFDELAVEVAESDEFSDPLNLGRGFPFADRTAFVLVHSESITR